MSAPVLNRRSVLLGLAAAAAASALPTATAATPGAEIAAAAPPANPLRWGWGVWRDGDEFIHGPYASREEALAAGKEHFGCDTIEGDESYGFDTVECDRVPVQHGDYHEALVNDLCEEGTNIAHTLQSCMEGANEDCDWEGEVAEAIAAVDWKAIEAAVLPAIWRAVERSGLFVLDVIDEEFDGDAALIEALDRDATFNADLQAIIHPMIEATGVMAASLYLNTYNAETHVFAVERSAA